VAIDTSSAFWSRPIDGVLQAVGATPAGLAAAEAAVRLARHGANALTSRRRRSGLAVLLAQARNPLLLLLAVAAGVSFANGEWVDALIVLAIVGASVGTAVVRESRAEGALAALQDRVCMRARLLRDGTVVEAPVEAVVPGDVVLLGAGSLVPADGVLLEATDCYVAEAALTGEAFPVEKRVGPVAAEAPLAQRSGAVFLGTNVRSGAARMLVVHTGRDTVFAGIAQRLEAHPPETEFDRGLRRFSYLLTASMVVLVLFVFAVHLWRGRPAVETLLFAVALAVGLTPELLPAILTVNLTRGAALMAGRGVLVRHLSAIENLGSMDVLCTDKTGTLTEGVVELAGAFDGRGEPSPAVLALAARNAALATGLASPLDTAIVNAHGPIGAAAHKLAELPFDFERKCVSVLVEENGAVRLVTKGAAPPLLALCTTLADGTALDAATRHAIDARIAAWSTAGIRVLAVADADWPRAVPASLPRTAERDLRLQGFLTFSDRPKAGARDAVADLAQLGVAVKLISGDTALVTQHVAGEVGLRADRVLTGREIAGLADDALQLRVEQTDLFAEVDPAQKERIIDALRARGHVVGFLGDGVNDAPAMRAADTSLSVDTAVDVAREAADFVLLERDLDVIRRGIEEGRRTFANIMKYVLTTMSANLGNMVSMAAASLLLPFLPLLASQILLNNFLSDIPAFGLADDAVDPELVATPPRWDVWFIARFMLVFGIVSSAFDALTFSVLLRRFHASAPQFQTGWFIESLLTELVIALVVRTRRPFFRSRPGALLLWSTAGLAALCFVVPWLPFADLVGFVPLSPALLLALAGITAAYVLVTEGAKRAFYGRV
jgi:Mg2+-importing ATPase